MSIESLKLEVSKMPPVVRTVTMLMSLGINNERTQWPTIAAELRKKFPKLVITEKFVRDLMNSQASKAQELSVLRNARQS